jgi:hypothetical protein
MLRSKVGMAHARPPFAPPWRDMRLRRARLPRLLYTLPRGRCTLFRRACCGPVETATLPPAGRVIAVHVATATRPAGVAAPTATHRRARICVCRGQPFRNTPCGRRRGGGRTRAWPLRAIAVSAAGVGRAGVAQFRDRSSMAGRWPGPAGLCQPARQAPGRVRCRDAAVAARSSAMQPGWRSFGRTRGPENCRKPVQAPSWWCDDGLVVACALGASAVVRVAAVRVAVGACASAAAMLDWMQGCGLSVHAGSGGTPPEVGSRETPCISVAGSALK